MMNKIKGMLKGKKVEQMETQMENLVNKCMQIEKELLENPQDTKLATELEEAKREWAELYVNVNMTLVKRGVVASAVVGLGIYGANELYKSYKETQMERYDNYDRINFTDLDGVIED